MALQLVKKQHYVESEKVSDGSVNFDNEVTAATVVIQGFEPAFQDQEDHSLLKLGLEITNINFSDKSVSYQVKFTLYDDDREHEGKANVNVLIIADVKED